jgi:hypothetical protein
MLRSESAAAGLIAMSADQYHTLALTPFGRDGATNVLVPAVESLYRKRLAADSGDDPITHCQSPGSPRILSPKPTKIIDNARRDAVAARARHHVSADLHGRATVARGSFPDMTHTPLVGAMR